MVDSQTQTNSGRKLFYGLFIFPLLIAVGMAILLCAVVLLTREVETPESLITSIKTGSSSKRWQKAFELSNELNQGRGMLRESGVMKEVIHILKDGKEYDAKTRSYMAIALSRFKEPEVVPVLREVLAQEKDPEVQLYLIWALGLKKASNAASLIAPYLENESADLRKMAAYVLGSLEDPKTIAALQPLLKDSERDVRWNAALSLARLGDDAGYEIILGMLDRNALAGQADLSETTIEEIMVNAAKGVALLKRKDAVTILTELSNNDSSLKVRQAAMESLEHIKK